MGMTRRTFLKLVGATALFSTTLPRSSSAAGALHEIKIPILLYHDISNLIHDDYTISPPTFSAQMEWLYASGYRALAVNEATEFLENAAGPPIVLTFDDGDTSFIDYALPLLKEYGFKATMNVIGQAVDTHALIDRQRPVLSWDECRYLLSTGLVELGCHSYALHSPGGVLSVSYGAIERDLAIFQKEFKKELGIHCTTLAWPYGIYDKKCIEIARKTGFTRILTSREGCLKRGGDMSELPRLSMNDKLDLTAFQHRIGAIP